MASNTCATHLVDWPENSDPRGRLRSQRGSRARNPKGVPMPVPSDGTRSPNVIPFPRNFQLYRLFDSRRNLLYVGITQQFPPSKRYQQHAKEKYWWHVVAYDTMCSLRTTDRSEAEAVERATILEERPRFNVMHQEKRARFARAGHGFLCGECKGTAFMVIADANGSWSSVCRDHEPDRGAPDLFNFVPWHVNSSAQLALMVHHLSAKSWFDFNRFAHFLTTNHNAEAC